MTTVKQRTSLSAYALIFSYLFLTATAFYVQKWDAWGSQKLISWDISGYYLYLPGFFYSNLGDLPQRQYIIDTYHPCSGDDIYAYKCPTGKYIIKYSSGMAILYVPGFVVGHIWAKIGHYPVDGFSYPYQFSMAMYSLLISFIGLWLIRKVLLRHFKDKAVTIVLLSLCLATNYLNYAAIGNMFSHNYLFTIYAAIIYFTESWYANPGYGKSCVLGLLCGLATLTRPTEVISVMVPVFWGLGSLAHLKERLLLILDKYRMILTFLLCAILVGSVQLIYWKLYSGHWIYWSYGQEEGFNFLKVPVWNVLFSYKKGWFAYTPWMILSLIGFIPLFLYNRKLFIGTFLFSFVALYITFSWKEWTYGGSFSQRAVVQYYALLLFPLTALISWALKKWYTTLPTILFLAFCIWINLIMTYQANKSGTMESDNMTKAYYWKIFGQLTVDKDAKKLIECEEEVPISLVPKLTLLTNKNFETDSSMSEDNYDVIGGARVFSLTKNKEFIPETRIDINGKAGSWLRGNFELYLGQSEDDYNHQPLLYAWLTGDSGEIKKNNYHLQRVIAFQRWDTLSIDIFIPEGSKGKYLKFGIYNPRGDVKLYVRNLNVQEVVAKQ